MASTPPGRGDGVRRRPKDRKAQIARASAEAFSLLGYHGVSMDAIAARVGISAAALYRHYTGKYELFRDAVLALGQQLVDATAFVDEFTPESTPTTRARPSTISRPRCDTALANRDSGGLYRWEARYLRGDDQATLDSQIRTVHRRFQQPLRALRPELDSRQRWTLSTAMISVLGSIVDHRAKLPAGQIRPLLAELVVTLVHAEFPTCPRRPIRRCQRPRAPLEIRSAACGIDAAVQPEGLPGHLDGGHRHRGGDARLGDLPVLLREE